MKHLFIINPAAGKYNHAVEFTAKIAAVCKPRGLDYETRISACAGDCTAIAKAAAQTGEDLRIYACGGDGTLNEVVTGVIGCPNVAVTHFPGGSGNDFIRIFGNTEPFSDLTQLLEPAESLLDVIRINEDRYALNICSMGIDARIGTEVARYKRIPGISGSNAYNISVAVNLLKGIHRPCEIFCNGQTVSGEHTLICICNGRYYGGGYNPVPTAEPDDGLLDVLTVRDVNALTFAKLIGLYKAGRYREIPKYITHLRTTDITIRTPENSVVNLDGEAYYGSEVRFTVLPKALRFFYPKSLFYREQTEENPQKEEILQANAD